MNCKLIWVFCTTKSQTTFIHEEGARWYAKDHPDDVLKIYNNGKLIDEMKATDCFNMPAIDMHTMLLKGARYFNPETGNKGTLTKLTAVKTLKNKS